MATSGYSITEIMGHKPNDKNSIDVREKTLQVPQQQTESQRPRECQLTVNAVFKIPYSIKYGSYYCQLCQGRSEGTACFRAQCIPKHPVGP